MINLSPASHPTTSCFQKWSRASLALRIVPVAGFIVLLSAGARAANPEPAAVGFIGKTSTFPETSPAPEGTTSRPLVTVQESKVPVEVILDKMEEQSGVRIRAGGTAARYLVGYFSARNMPVEEALEKLAGAHRWVVYRPAPGTFELWDESSYKETVLPRLRQERTILVRNISAEEAARAATGRLTPNIGGISFDSRTNKLRVYDLPFALEKIERLVEEIDVAWTTRVFAVSHANVKDLADSLREMQTRGAPKPIVDHRTRQIIIQDRLDVIRRMEPVVDTLDIPTPPAPGTEKRAGGTTGTVAAEQEQR